MAKSSHRSHHVGFYVTAEEYADLTARAQAAGYDAPSSAWLRFALLGKGPLEGDGRKGRSGRRKKTDEALRTSEPWVHAEEGRRCRACGALWYVGWSECPFCAETRGTE